MTNKRREEGETRRKKDGRKKGWRKGVEGEMEGRKKGWMN